jgi:transposase
MSKTTKPTNKAVAPSAPTAPIAKESAKTSASKQPVLSVIKDIQRQSRKQYSAEEKIRIVLEGIRGESSVAEICRREGLNTNVYYRWSKEFLEAGKKRLMGDTIREATGPEVQTMKTENEALKQLVAELSLENRLLKKSLKAEE